MTKSINTREIVLDLLLEWEKGAVFSHRLIRDVLNKYNYLSGQEKGFIKRLAEGTIERQIELDYRLEQVSSVPVHKMKPLIRSLLRMSVYQILYMDSVPDAAAVSEAVKLAGKRKFQNLKGFVNGVLRSAAKQKEAQVYPDPGQDMTAYLSVRYSMPVWLVEKWLEDYGRENTERILEGMLQARPVTIRFAGGMTESQREDWKQQVRDLGVKVRSHPYLPYAAELEGAEGIGSLPGYQEGNFAVQDVSSMLAVEAAGVKPGDFVLDVCAAPGGKTMLAAEKVMPDGRVTARDVSESKVDLLRENLERMDLHHVKVEVRDATLPDESLKGKADVVLADVPCSGLGVIGRKKDIKYRVSKEQLGELEKLQKAILKQAVSYVRENGILLYSTCTINKQENQEMVQWICREFSFQPEDMSTFLPRDIEEESVKSGMLQLLPGVHDSDGFFFARLRKKAVRGSDRC
ncbi:MAG: 16S rRNA (cytosine(967)-C(5))-methyltransferase RsmB [Lachnospiraceae bacterium]|nr:16S rRNA (cytosine(967)-C(5))-methyltransferase RsmB [Lachnospiraceae bacterium]